MGPPDGLSAAEEAALCRGRPELAPAAELGCSAALDPSDPSATSQSLVSRRSRSMKRTLHAEGSSGRGISPRPGLLRPFVVILRELASQRVFLRTNLGNNG